MQEERQTIQSEDTSNIPTSMLISATYNGQKKKTVLKFYEPKSEKIFYGLIKLITNHIAIQREHVMI